MQSIQELVERAFAHIGQADSTATLEQVRVQYLGKSGELTGQMKLLGGLAPEWFGLNTDDGQMYQAHMPELYISKDAPRYRFE